MNPTHSPTEVDPDAPETEGLKCGAKRQRGYMGYCQHPAGFGTDHLGTGRCHLHGGRGDEVPKEALAAAPWLAERTRKLSVADAEALMVMGTMAMVLARATLMERLLSPGITAKESNEITMSVTRLDNLLSKHPELQDPDAPSNHGPAPVDEELKRLLQLEAEQRT